MNRDPQLEELSEKVRRGEPIGFLDAIAVINYQRNLRDYAKANTCWARLKRWFKANLKP